MSIRALAYVTLETANLDAWATFAHDFLGTPIVRPAGSTDRLLLRMDERSYRFDIRAGTEERLLRLGFETGSAAEFEAVATELTSRGIAIERGSREDAKERGVVDVFGFDDPAGNRLEVFYGQEADFRPLTLTRSMSGYLTGPLGMGHAVIGVTDYERNFEFYTQTLGFRVSDTFKGFIAFLHCNPRHHTIAIVGTDKPGLRHVMLETRSIDDVGAAIDIAKRMGCLTRSLGRHTNDEAISFYVETPSGWEIEYGWAGLHVDEEAWTVRQLAGPTSLWGHELVGGRELTSTAR